MLFRAIKFELSRAFRDKYFVISLLIGGIIVTLDIVTFYTQYIEPKNASLIQAWIGTDFAFAYHSFVLHFIASHSLPLHMVEVIIWICQLVMTKIYFLE